MVIVSRVDTRIIYVSSFARGWKNEKNIIYVWTQKLVINFFFIIVCKNNNFLIKNEPIFMQKKEPKFLFLVRMKN